MALFEFDKAKDKERYLLGQVREVDTRKVSVLVDNDKDLRKARVNQLIAIAMADGTDTWLIGLIDKVIKSVVQLSTSLEPENDEDETEDEDTLPKEAVVNTVKLTLMGTARWNNLNQKPDFSRSLNHVPEIDAECYVLKDANLEAFMGILSSSTEKAHALDLGVFTLDEKATAFLDGNKLFQRHAALLGSTGSGKSWTVASVLERSAKLRSSNLVVFDLHGEYKNLSYARQLRIPGPDELKNEDDGVLYLPYWMLNTEELQSMFIDSTEFSAHNQVMAFQDIVVEEKKKTLSLLQKHDVLAAFTLDSPIPFDIKNVIAKITHLNEEMVQGARGLKQGAFYGQFSRLLLRLNSKLNDRRYGFMFQAPDTANDYDALAAFAEKLAGFTDTNSQIKIIDFSEVPSDILPVVIGLVARLLYQIQFWTNHEQRRPIALVCDEAHLYLPRGQMNPVEKRAVEAFEKIAKEGRKYGVALMIVSQRPSDVSETVLSQCNNVIALRLTNGDDQNTVKKMLPESLESLLEALPVMDVGEALVVGDSVLLPSRIKIHPPADKPLSATVDFWSRWQESVAAPDFIRIIENMRRQSRREP
ncbi:ATP-binding protein [Sansalvadorimonas sp. 2012CJ34-2]|uniref:ATP-binding protein n=1 Tax=Parendozoicomonas callyspongiae TaxID=2942213 RepID=A0ABT0PKJ8_9GAMM|nr:ATP-binding protein [Sansalvadorimonas sp. 2012CJ34-2]MCL6271914.1 ATP-binding protein [Sansalvadorimonas sp. 2012CJ34-2]